MSSLTITEQPYQTQLYSPQVSCSLTEQALSLLTYKKIKILRNSVPLRSMINHGQKMTMKIKMIPVKVADGVTTSVLKLQLLCKMRGNQE